MCINTSHNVGEKRYFIIGPSGRGDDAFNAFPNIPEDGYVSRNIRSVSDVGVKLLNHSNGVLA